jgi:hypothetical protein
MTPLKVVGFDHPEYTLLQDEWEKYRYIMEGGDEFIDQYIKKFSDRETATDLTARKAITPSAAFARGAILDIKNSIFQRMSDIVRKGGSDEYQAAIKGLNGGVDQRGSSMNYFIGRKILQELLFLGKIGVYVDMPTIPNNPTLRETKSKVPYFYHYAAEDIINWDVSFQDNTMAFTQIFLRDHYYRTSVIGLPSDLTYRYRQLILTDNGVIVRFYDPDSLVVDKSSVDSKFVSNGIINIKNVPAGTTFTPSEEYVLDLPKIPFVLFELEQPLTRDIANHQIALMNLESSDISYALKANYPFYTEQRSSMNGSYLKNEENSETGSEIEAGGTVGRAYAKGLDRPDFIHPSSEPMTASMEKQRNLKDDIRTLVNLSLTSIRSKFSSAESKELDERGLESGLSALGLILEQGERELAEIFSLYERTSNAATVLYPQKYSLKTDIQKLDEVGKLADQREKIPSKKCQKLISKKMASILIGTDVTADELQEVLDEIEQAEYITSDSETINLDIEHGLVSLETAAVARGYNKEEVAKAKTDHAERLARIAATQTKNTNDPQENKEEKAESQNPDVDDTGHKSVRGNATKIKKEN